MPVEYGRSVLRGTVVDVTFWSRSIALYRGDDGVLRAIENRCAHRQLKLSLGTVTGCRLTCMYHGWAYDETGRLVDIPHELFGRPMPRLGVTSYPVQVRYGLVWLFPGHRALAGVHSVPDVAELEGAARPRHVILDVVWRAHHSVVIEHLSDGAHAWSPGRDQRLIDARLTRCET